MRITIALAVACLTITGLSVATESDAAIKRYDLNIPRQSLDAALKDLAQQTGLQVGRFSDAVKGDTIVGPVTGRYTAPLALDALLESSGLIYRSLNDRAVIVLRPEDVAQLAPSVQGEEAGFARLAQSGTSSPSPAAGEGAPKDADGGRIQEVIVTAQKRGEEKLQDVPISMAVLSSEKLDSSNYVGVNELLRSVPGLYVVTSPTGTTQFTVRGVTSNPSFYNGASVVGYYLDEIPFGFVRFPTSPDTSAYDLERVEVLRGPQGTLYGANSVNGVIRVLTQPADLDELQFKARASTMGTNDGGQSNRLDGALSAPLIPDVLGMRLVAGRFDQAGWVEQPATGRNDYNSGVIENYRLKLNAEPLDNLRVSLLSWWSRTDFNGTTVESEDGTVLTDVDEPQHNSFDAYGLTVEYDFPGFTLTSATSTIDYQAGMFLDFGVGLPAEAYSQTDISANLLSQEIRLASNTEGPWRWTVGGIYRDAEDENYQIAPSFAPGRAANTLFRSESMALFGEVTRALASNVDLTVGLRYFHDEAATEDLSTLSAAATPVFTEDEYEQVTPRVVLSWRPNDDFSLYASYGQGFRSGFATGAINAPSVPRSVQPDLLSNYEVGAKGALWNDRLNYEVAIYYMDWQDAVQRLQVPSGFVLPSGVPVFTNVAVNSETVSGPGVDISLNAEVIDGLTVGFSASWNDLTFAEDVISGGNPVFRKGDRLDNSPETTAAAFFEYGFPLGGRYEVQIDGSANYHTYVKSQSPTTGVVVRGVNGTTADFGLSLVAPDHWTVRLFGTNVTDNRDQIGTNNTRLRPATFGIQLEYKY